MRSLLALLLFVSLVAWWFRTSSNSVDPARDVPTAGRLPTHSAAPFNGSATAHAVQATNDRSLAHASDEPHWTIRLTDPLGATLDPDRVGLKLLDSEASGANGELLARNVSDLRILVCDEKHGSSDKMPRAFSFQEYATIACTGKHTALGIGQGYIFLASKQLGPHQVELTLLAVRSLDVHTTDADSGESLAGVLLELHAFDPTDRALIQRRVLHTMHVQTDARGEARLSIPSASASELEVRHEGYGITTVLLDAGAPASIALGLRPFPTKVKWVLTGHVRLPDGRPAANAVLHGAGWSAKPVAADGSFEVVVAPDRQTELTLAPLVAKLRGRAQTLRYEDSNPDPLDPLVRRTDGIELELFESPHALDLSVRDAQGAPVSGLEVWLASGRAVRCFGGFIEGYESLPAHPWSANLPNLGKFVSPTTDSSGRVGLSGLGAPPHEVVLFDDECSVSYTLERDGIHELVFERPTLRLVEGVALDLCGQPLAGAEVSVADRLGNRVLERLHTGSVTTSADDGRFVLETRMASSPNAFVSVRVDGVALRTTPIAELLVTGELRAPRLEPLVIENRSALQGRISFYSAAGERLDLVYGDDFRMFARSMRLPQFAEEVGLEVDRCAVRAVVEVNASAPLEYAVIRDGNGFARLQL